MPFGPHYGNWNHNRVKAIIDHYGHAFFAGKTILDLGCGHGSIASQFHRMGAILTCCDARQENLVKLKSQYPDLQTRLVNLDEEFPFDGKFDLVLSLGLLSHLRHWEQHLRDICSVGENVILETEVLDSSDPTAYQTISQDTTMNDVSFSGEGSIVSPYAIQRVLSEFGAIAKRVDKRTINSGENVYDWKEINAGVYKPGQRRMWFIQQHKLLDKLFDTNRNIRSTHSEALRSNNIAPAAAPTRQYQKPASYEERIMSRMSTPPKTDGNVAVSGARQRKMEREAQVYSGGPVGQINAPDVVWVSPIRKFVIVIASFNNQDYVERNLLSALDQNYGDYRIIYTDDCSRDGTYERAKGIVERHPKGGLVQLIRNTERKGALENLFDMIHSCEDEEIIITLDGDDWLNGNEVLGYLSSVYQDTNIFISYGQYKNSTDGGIGVAKPYSDSVIRANSFRSAPWSASHLRAMYAWLFKLIRKQDLMFNGKFVQSAWDLSLMLPTLECAGTHSRYLNEVLYIYNLSNPLNDHKVDRNLQARMDKYVRSQPKYSPINTVVKVREKETPKPKVGLLLISTNKYTQYIPGFVSSADSFFMKGSADVSYFVFTDKGDQKIQTSRPITYIPIEHKPWPHATLKRYEFFWGNREKLAGMDYLIYTDIDALFVDEVKTDILGDLISVLHCGYYKCTQEAQFIDDPNSLCYAPKEKYEAYYAGGMQGGSKERYLELCRWCSETIEQELAAGRKPVWDDESIYNYYLLQHPPTVKLNPSYHYPESNIQHYKAKWKDESIRPKFLLLDKQHSQMRT